MTTRNHIDLERVLAHLGSVKLAYSVDDLATVTPLSRFFWYSAINSEKLPAVKANEKTIVLFWDLVEFLEALPAYHLAPGKDVRTKNASVLRARRQSDVNGGNGPSRAANDQKFDADGSK